ncbi:hypothetical protein Tco_1433307, partial [Tanacetum coccineum]
MEARRVVMQGGEGVCGFGWTRVTRPNLVAKEGDGVFRVPVQDLEGDKFRKLSEERVETIKADPATKNQGVEPTTEHHEGVQITSIPLEVAPVIEENVDYQNDDKESSPLLDAYLKRDEAEQNATPSTYVDK